MGGIYASFPSSSLESHLSSASIVVRLFHYINCIIGYFIGDDIVGE